MTTNRSVAIRGIRSVVRIALGLAIPAAVLAQESGGQDVLQEVTVTAQFRAQSVQDTPLSITAVSGEILESRSQTNLSEVANQAPNVTLKPQGAAYGPALEASDPRRGSVLICIFGARARRRPLR